MSSVDQIISKLPELEPMLGVAFALNLAYIGLPRFRYREEIRKEAETQLKLVQNPSVTVKGLDWYQKVSRLALMPDNKSGTSRNADLPKEEWATTYKRYYENHFDRKICIFNASVCAGLISLGNAHQIEYLRSINGHDIEWLFSGIPIHIWFWLVIVAMLVPVNFVRKGGYVVHEACEWARQTIKGGKETLKAAALAATAPEGNSDPAE